MDLQFWWHGISGNHQGGANSGSQFDGDSDMVSTCQAQYTIFPEGTIQSLRLSCARKISVTDLDISSINRQIEKLCEWLYMLACLKADNNSILLPF